MGGVVAVVLVLAAVRLPGVDAATTQVRLDRPGADARWAGQVPNGVVADPALCVAETCEVVELELAAGVERLVVAVDTSEVENTFDFAYDITLHVYGPDGASAGSEASSFESNVVVVDRPAAGRWLVLVVPERVVGDLHYRGYAAATRIPRLRPPVRDLLPNLVPQPLTNLRIESAPFAGPPPLVWDFRDQVHSPSSCYPQEIIELGAHRCLRFDQTVANLGDGPMELRARQVGDGPMDQRIHRTDGSVREEPVGAAQLHLQHLHFHFRDYAVVRLHDVTPAGRRGAVVREGRKQGFCLADTRNMRFGRPDQVPAAYTDPETCDGRDEAPAFSRVGISPGWADTYPWYLVEQFIEISGVPDGRYELVFSVNETGALHESTLADNEASVRFDLRGDTVTMLLAP